MKKYKYIVFLLLCHASLCFGQNTVAKVVTLDELVIKASLENFSVEEFIEQVRNDTTFYKAFLNLKYFPHDVMAAITVYNKDDSEKGILSRKARQFLNENNEAWMDITFEETNGKIKKRNGEWSYLTAEMFDDVFFETDTHPVSNKIVKREQELTSGSKIEKHKAQLKRMLFNPGEEIGNVPFIGDKMAIFDEDMVQHYDYNIFLVDYADSIPCIAFSCQTKAGADGEETVIKDLTTYFDTESNQVIAREYRLAHNTIFFDFDIKIKVENIQIEGKLLPVYISYAGYWNVPLKKPEIVAFQIKNSNYDIHQKLPAE